MCVPCSASAVAGTDHNLDLSLLRVQLILELLNLVVHDLAGPVHQTRLHQYPGHDQRHPLLIRTRPPSYEVAPLLHVHQWDIDLKLIVQEVPNGAARHWPHHPVWRPISISHRQLSVQRMEWLQPLVLVAPVQEVPWFHLYPLELALPLTLDQADLSSMLSPIVTVFHPQETILVFPIIQFRVQADQNGISQTQR